MRIAIALTLLASLPAQAASYVVSASGNDSGDGSAAHPWKTIQHAADQTQPGDTVTVQSGTYAGFQIGFDTPKSGTAAMPITFKGMPGAIINSANAKTQDGIDLEGSSYIVIDGFEVTGVSRAGIRTVSDGNPNATNVTIQNCNTHDNGTWGILTGHVDNLLITNNHASKTVMQHGIYVSNACVKPVVRGNVIFSNNDNGLHMNGDLSQGGNGLITGALVEKNIIYDNGAGGGSGINCDGVQGSTIQNNLIYNEHASGISLYQTDAAQPAINNVIVNNTVIVASGGRWAINIQNASTGNTLVNNILLNDNGTRGAIDSSADSLSGLTSDYNVVVDRFTPDDNTTIALAAWQTMTGQDKHSIIGTTAQLFVSASDFHLLAAAPAIGKGTMTHAPADDLDGHARSGAIDVGAYQYCNGCMNPDGGAAGGGGSGGGGGSDMAGTMTVGGNDLGSTGKKAAGCSCDFSGAPTGAGWGYLVPLVLWLAVRGSNGRRSYRTRRSRPICNLRR